MGGNAMYKLSYGLFVVTANKNGKDNGCISNTVTQVTSEPNQISVALNKSNLTHDYIKDTKIFSVSVLSENADFEVFKHFGFKSGYIVDKFTNYRDAKRVSNGTMAITKGTNAYISAKVTDVIDLGTHSLFIAKVVGAELFSNTPSATYAYYQEHIKPKPGAKSEKDAGKSVWRCTVCGYEYVGEELPADYICPICKHPASVFEKV